MKFQTKLTVCMILLISLIYGVGGALLISFSFDNSLELERSQTLESYKALRSTLILANTISTQSSEEDFAEILKTACEQNTMWQALRLYSRGKALYTYGEIGLLDDSLANECSESACAMKILDTPQGRILQITGSFTAGETKLFLETSKSVEGIYAARDTQLKIYKALFAAVAAMSAMVSFATARLLTSPLRSLSRTAKRIAGGDLSIRAKIMSNDEMGELAQSFNNCADSLTEKISQLEDEMKRREQFTGSFAHELKTPMTSMIGYADLLRSCNLSKKQQRECAEYIFNESKRLERLSLKLLDLFVLQQRDFEMQMISPSQLLISVAKSLDKKLCGCNIAMDVHIEQGECMLEADLTESLLINLIDNAVKAMENGGVIDVAQTMTESGCRFVVKDCGRGIPQSEIERITEAFYRVDKARSRRQGGAGLGLALCAEIAALHGGELKIESAVGVGTTVTVELKGGAE